jgi:hypothetical protein
MSATCNNVKLYSHKLIEKLEREREIEFHKKEKELQSAKKY